MVDINNNTVLKFNKDVLLRFEHNLNGGTMILCNLKTKEFWFGNVSSREFLRRIDGEKTLNDIYAESLQFFDEDEYENVVNAYNAILEELLEKTFVEVVCNDEV